MKIAFDFPTLWPDAFGTHRCACFETTCVLGVLVPNLLPKNMAFINEDDC